MSIHRHRHHYCESADKVKRHSSGARRDGKRHGCRAQQRHKDQQTWNGAEAAVRRYGQTESMVGAKCEVRVAWHAPSSAASVSNLSRKELVRQQQSDGIARSRDEPCMGRAETIRRAPRRDILVTARAFLPMKMDLLRVRRLRIEVVHVLAEPL